MKFSDFSKFSVLNMRANNSYAPLASNTLFFCMCSISRPSTRKTVSEHTESQTDAVCVVRLDTVSRHIFNGWRESTQMSLNG